MAFNSTLVYGIDPSINLQTMDGSFQAYKKPILLNYEYASAPTAVQTLEGVVHCVAGDAILTGTQAENWPIKREVFESTYDVIGKGIASKKKINIFVCQMQVNFQVKVSWSGDLLEGDPGDYLVQYGKNDFGVVKESIFGETYSRV